MLHRKEHLSPNGLQQIVNIRALINNGLSDTLKVAFPHVTPVPRPVVEPSEIPDPNWLAGFVAGEGHFMINIIKSSSCKLGFQVRLLFKITQHSRDSVLMQIIVGYLGCGRCYLSPVRESVDFLLTNFSDIDQKIIPLFEKYPLHGVKSKDFTDFGKAAEIIKVKGHLTPEGLEQLYLIKAGMNTGRANT
ncbi:homing endonuclease [Tirmania nivea]|nr:homing endonuclease [Tirmania nivea]